jgi:hypothetical protein
LRNTLILNTIETCQCRENDHDVTWCKTDLSYITWRAWSHTGFPCHAPPERNIYIIYIYMYIYRNLSKQNYELQITNNRLIIKLQRLSIQYVKYWLRSHCFLNWFTFETEMYRRVYFLNIGNCWSECTQPADWHG